MIESMLFKKHSGYYEDDGVVFLGEVASADLLAGPALSRAVGLTAGYDINLNEPWLHFNDKGKTLYVARKPLRHMVRYAHLDNLGIVKGSKTVMIKGKVYKVRLLKGAATENVQSIPSSGYDPVELYGSEWNRLLYRICTAPTEVSGEGIRFASLAQYTDSQLGARSLDGTGNGSYSYCQERIFNAGGSSDVLVRGANGIHFYTTITSSGATTWFGWRPVLELVN